MARLWTPEKAEAAVKAAFFSRGVALLGEPEKVWLRFTEIKRVIAFGQSPIGDRTLSRVLASLVEKGHLRKRSEGKFSLYNLVVPLVDGARALGGAEGSAIEAAGKIGGWGDPMVGWAALGIPPVLPRRYRKILRDKCIQHQDALREVLDEVWEEAADAYLAPARRRVPRDVFRAGEKALRDLVEFQAAGAVTLSHSTRFWHIVERAIPGAARSFQHAMLPGIQPEAPISERIALMAATAGGKAVEELRPEVDRELARWEAKVQKAVARTDPLWKALTPKDKARVARRFEVAASMTVNLVSVVHV